MEPVEVNAGAWYLRALRADERVDDRPALCTGAADPDTRRYAGRLVLPDLAAAGAHVAERARQWEADEWYAWAVCEPTTGELVAEVGLRDVDLRTGCAELALWTVPAWRGRGAATTAGRAVLRLALAPATLGGLGLHRVSYAHAVSNTASARLADRLDLVAEGTHRGAALVDGAHEDLVVLARLATDVPAPRT